VLTTRFDRTAGTPYLVLAVFLPAAALAYFKYADFLAANFLFFAGPSDTTTHAFSIFRSAILPAGISFYTFHLISYCLDRRSGRIPDNPPFSHFALYITFFPHLVAGPILRYNDIKDALDSLNRFMPSAEDVASAISYVCMGLAAKVLIADMLGGYVDDLVHAGPGNLTRAAALFVVFAYSFQIYFDFYGYSLVAIGLARLFGFRFPDNFKRPYEALNPKDFWRRWHVSLSMWLRDYVYLPLGGNRRYTLNILCVFALCGLWHGAGWNFVVWGLYHAILVLAYAAVGPVWDRLPKLVQSGLNFSAVSMGWVLFLFNFDDAYKFLTGSLWQGQGGVGIGQPFSILVLAMAAFVCFGLNIEALAARADRPASRALAFTGAMAMLAIAVVLGINMSRDFIYFRF
jgi:alginate O-acetyltransferase complex protein AlgI